MSATSQVQDYRKDREADLKKSRFNRMKDRDETRLSETQPFISTPNISDNDVKLMNNKKPNEIMITNKIVQSHEVEDPSSSRKEESAIITGCEQWENVRTAACCAPCPIG